MKEEDKVWGPIYDPNPDEDIFVCECPFCGAEIWKKPYHLYGECPVCGAV